MNIEYRLEEILIKLINSEEYDEDISCWTAHDFQDILNKKRLKAKTAILELIRECVPEKKICSRKSCETCPYDDKSHCSDFLEGANFMIDEIKKRMGESL